MQENVGATIEELGEYLDERGLRGSGVGGQWGKAMPQAAPPASYAEGHWRWEHIYAGLMQSGSLVSLGASGMTEMRVVAPVGHRRPISLGAQILMPGERTRAHRNMKNETRLVHEAPSGAVFVCHGEVFPMERGDLIVSPTWTDHDHYNGGDTPAIWIDGFDLGYSSLAENLNERYPDDNPYQSFDRTNGYGLKTLGHVRAVHSKPPSPLPVMRYPWGEAQAALVALRDSETGDDPYDGLSLMYVNPVDRGPTLPTIAWHVQMLRPGQRTRAHRHNSTAFYYAFEGNGAITIEGEQIEWGPGDLFVVPPWTWHSHRNQSSSDECILFSIDDWPALTSLGFYKLETED